MGEDAVPVEGLLLLLLVNVGGWLVWVQVLKV